MSTVTPKQATDEATYDAAADRQFVGFVTNRPDKKTGEPRNNIAGYFPVGKAPVGRGASRPTVEIAGTGGTTSTGGARPTATPVNSEAKLHCSSCDTSVPRSQWADHLTTHAAA